MTPFCYNSGQDVLSATAPTIAVILLEMEQVCKPRQHDRFMQRIIHFTICQSPDALWAFDVTSLMHYDAIHLPAYSEPTLLRIVELTVIAKGSSVSRNHAPLQ